MGFLGKSRLLVAVTVAAALSLTACNSAGQQANGGGAAAAGQGKSAFDTLRGLTDAVKAKSTTAKSAHFTFTGSAAGEELKGEGDYTFGATPGMQMTIDTPDGAVSMRLIDSIVYIKTPQELEPGKAWIKLDLNDKDNPLAAMLGKSLESARQTDPTKTLEQLADVSEITGVKAEEVNGQKTTRYSLSVDVAKLQGKAAEMGMDPSSVAEIEKAGVKTIPADVWINADDLPVRYVMEFPVKSEKVKIQADYSDWGKAVDITAPPADQVAEFPTG
ncbi:hypothetical protein JOD54_000220 [Actinokineospora baliensis]|uniref:hypothetical protein n=1 Tax=Actinokineospora baliensis TaxID=547056 RepID=UPI00195D0B98|nr:hypothetical protein [Actinokineospora baliensis]MBM7770016.1 hypothetical protein [Actinokineospora baliensis]